MRCFGRRFTGSDMRGSVLIAMKEFDSSIIYGKFPTAFRPIADMEGSRAVGGLFEINGAHGAPTGLTLS